MKALTLLVMYLAIGSAVVYGYWHNLYLMAVSDSFFSFAFLRAMGVAFPPLGVVLGFF